jgi:hypothetical protein
MKRAADSMPSGLTGLKIVSEIKQNSRRVRDLGANRGGVDLRYADLSRRGEPQPKLALSRTHSDDYKTWNRVADDIPSPLKCAHLEKCSVFSYKLFHTEIDF